MRITIGPRRVGFDETGQGTPLLLMHAFPLDRSMFQPQVEALRTAARIITFDVPGIGESEPGPAAMDDIADVAAGLLDALEIAKAVVGGVSMGGYASFSFARGHSERLLGLVLANTRTAADSGEAKAGRREMAAVARKQGASEIAHRLLPKLLGETTRKQRPAIIERVRAMIEAADPEAIARLLDSLANRADSTGVLREISVPALVIAGEEDPLAPPTEASRWASMISDSRFVQISQAGHLPNLETPEVFNSELQQFVREITAKHEAGAGK